MLRSMKLRINLWSQPGFHRFHLASARQFVLRNPIAGENNRVTFNGFSFAGIQICNFNSLHALSSEYIRYALIRQNWYACEKIGVEYFCWQKDRKIELMPRQFGSHIHNLHSGMHQSQYHRKTDDLRTNNDCTLDRKSTRLNSSH